MPQWSHPVDRLSAAHFTQILEKDRHRFQPVAVAVDHGVLEAGLYFSGAIFHRHGSSLFYNRFVAEWSNQLRVTLAGQVLRSYVESNRKPKNQLRSMLLLSLFISCLSWGSFENQT